MRTQAGVGRDAGDLPRRKRLRSIKTCRYNRLMLKRSLSTLTILRPSFLLALLLRPART